MSRAQMSQDECIKEIVSPGALASFLFVLIAEGDSKPTDSRTASQTDPSVSACRSFGDPISYGRRVAISCEVNKAVPPTAACTHCEQRSDEARTAFEPVALHRPYVLAARASKPVRTEIRIGRKTDFGRRYLPGDEVL